MKALLSIAPGGPDTLQFGELHDREPANGELRVRVLACGINYPDVLIIEDKYQVKPQRPFAPGGEIAGIVEAIGAGVESWKLGDRVIAVIGYGGLSELAYVPAQNAVRLPEGRDPVVAAALLLTYDTALHALVDRGQLLAGETLLVLGAAGGVGLAAIEIGKALGAVIVAAVSSDRKAEAAKAAGADRTLVYGHSPFDKAASKRLADAFKAAVGKDGAHVIFDPVGGEYAEPALRSIAWEGRYLVVGFPAGIPKLPLNLALLKSCDIRGVFWGAFAGRKPDREHANIERLMAWWSDGTINPRIDQTYPLVEGGKAIARLAARSAIGKVVVTMS